MTTTKILLVCLIAGVCLLQQGYALLCYECNSHNNSECALDVPPDSLKTDCSTHKDGSKYIMCRKITQIIEFEVNGLPPDNRVIRACGWDDSNYKGRCYQRSGFGGRQEVCSCLEDLCNAAPHSVSAPAALVLATVAATLALLGITAV